MRITHVNSCWIILGVSPGPFPAFPAPFFWEIPQIPPHYSGHWEASPQSCFSQAAQKLARNEMELFQRAAAPPQYNPNNDNHCIALFIYIVIFKKKMHPQQIQKSKPLRYCNLSDHLWGFSFPGLFHGHSLSWSIAMLWSAFIVSCTNWHPIGRSISQVSIHGSHRSHGNPHPNASILSSNRLIPSSSHTGTRWWCRFGIDVLGKRWPPSQAPRKWEGRDSCTGCCWNDTRSRNGTRWSRSRPTVGILQVRSPRRLRWLCFT